MNYDWNKYKTDKYDWMQFFIDKSAPYINAEFLNKFQYDYLNLKNNAFAVYQTTSESASPYYVLASIGETEAPTEYPTLISFIPDHANVFGEKIKMPWDNSYFEIYNPDTKQPVEADMLQQGVPVILSFDGNKFWLHKGNHLEVRATHQESYFDRLDTNPTGTARLNYNGYMWANRFYGAVYNPYSADFAEGYPVIGEHKPGDLIAINPDGTFSKNTKDYNTKILGIVSDEYAVLCGTDFGDTPIAECGRVHAYVKGSCTAGDYLRAEGDHLVFCSEYDRDIPAGTIVAQALEEKQTEGIEKILVRINRR